jgi:hypothetical protein
VAAGAILGALLGGIIVFVLEWVESGVLRSSADVERFLGLTVIGAIPLVEGAAAQRRDRRPSAAARTAQAAR